MIEREEELMRTAIDPGAEALPYAEAHERSRLGRVGVLAGKVVFAAGLSGMAGIAGAAAFPTEVEIGPHRAEAALTFDSAVTLDFGAPGSIIKPISAYGLGADIEIKEISSGYPEGGEEADFTAADIEEYARFFANYDADVDEIRGALAERIGTGSLAGAGTLLGLYLLLGRRRRQELSESAGQVGQSRAAKIVAATAIVAGTLSGGISSADDRGIAVSPAFDGTMLEGARIEGKILQVLINKYGTDVLEYIEANDAFYDMVRDNLEQAHETGIPLRADSDHDLMLFYTDLHCNIGMGEVIGQAAHLFDVSVAISGGDETMSGTDIEEQCIRIVADRLGSIRRVVSTGNHDSAATEDQFRKYGFVVLDGEPVDVAGYRFIGDDDPRRSVIGQEIRQEREETTAEMADRLADSACSDSKQVDVIVSHDPDISRFVLDRGCAEFGLSGHTHHGNFEERSDRFGINRPLLTGDSVGGAEHDRPTLGPLQTDARFYILKVNRHDGSMYAYQAVSVRTDGIVRLSPISYSSQEAVSSMTNELLGPRPR